MHLFHDGAWKEGVFVGFDAGEYIYIYIYIHPHRSLQTLLLSKHHHLSRCLYICFFLSINLYIYMFFLINKFINLVNSNMYFKLFIYMQIVSALINGQLEIMQYLYCPVVLLLSTWENLAAFKIFPQSTFYTRDEKLSEWF